MNSASRPREGWRGGALLAVAVTGPTLAQINLAQAANQDELRVPTVEVHGRTTTDTYQSGITNVGKIPMAARDIPQSLTTVTSQLMKERGADTMKDALRNVAGLTFNAGEGGRIGDNITLRGYSAVGDLYLDGMRDIAQYNRETFNLERIEVLRGSASMIFGRGSTGGIINQVSKAPLAHDQYVLLGTLGTQSYRRALADLNRGLGETAGLRLNLMKTDTGSFREGVSYERWGVAPSVSVGLGTPHEFNLAHYRLREDNVPDFGIPYFRGRPLEVPASRFFGLSTVDFERNDTAITTASYTWRASADTTLRTLLRHADYDRDLRASAPRLPGGTTMVTDDTAVNRQRQWRGGHEKTLTSQTNLTTRLEALGMKHLLLTGLELVREDATRWNVSSPVAIPATTVGAPNPWLALPPTYFDPVTRTGQVWYTANTVGVYAQDVVELAPAWKAVLGARYDHFSADYDRPAPQLPLSRTDKVWSWRAGLLYQPSDWESYYASYGTSFNPSGELYALDDRGTNTPPEKNRNIELGAKWELLQGDMSVRSALFRSEKTNERNTDLAVTVEQNLLAGKRHTDGIELELAGRLTPDWQLFGAVAFMTANIDAATGSQANTLGKVPINTPNHTFNLWTVYRLGPWRFGGGIEGAGQRYANPTNTTALPEYARWDGMVAYEASSWTARLNIYNLFDQTYYEGVYQGHTVPGLARATRLTLETRF